MTPPQIAERLRNRAAAFTLDVEYLEAQPPTSDYFAKHQLAKIQGYKIAATELRNLADEIERTHE